VTSIRRLWLVPIIAALAVGVWAGYLWARDFSLFAVDHVTIDGVHSREAGAIERALTQTARRMTIFHVREDELEHSVDGFPEVRSVAASTRFPNTLHIEVEEYEPVAALESGDGRRIAVAASGILLRSVGSSDALPVVQVNGLPQGRTLDRGVARTLVSVLGAAPARLRPLLARAYVSGNGVRVPVRDGPVILFGKPSRISAKWAAATRVLADPAAGGARFVDVRLPERPAASKAVGGTIAASDAGGTTGPAGGTTGPAGGTTGPAAANTQP
jgi:cell division protein FtsQ